MNLRRKPCLEEVCFFFCVPQIGCIVSKREVLYERHMVLLLEMRTFLVLLLFLVLMMGVG
jgi:hypothetical protein